MILKFIYDLNRIKFKSKSVPFLVVIIKSCPFDESKWNDTEIKSHVQK